VVAVSADSAAEIRVAAGHPVTGNPTRW